MGPAYDWPLTATLALYEVSNTLMMGSSAFAGVPADVDVMFVVIQLQPDNLPVFMKEPSLTQTPLAGKEPPSSPAAAAADHLTSIPTSVTTTITTTAVCTTHVLCSVL